MGIFSNLFSKKEKTTPQPIQTQPQKPKAVIKSQRFILDNIEEHMEDIMEIVDKNEDYKLKEKDLKEDDRTDEKIYEYELNEKATITPISCEGGWNNYKYLYATPILETLKKAA